MKPDGTSDWKGERVLMSRNRYMALVMTGKDKKKASLTFYIAGKDQRVAKSYEEGDLIAVATAKHALSRDAHANNWVHVAVYYTNSAGRDGDVGAAAIYINGKAVADETHNELMTEFATRNTQFRFGVCSDKTDVNGPAFEVVDFSEECDLFQGKMFDLRFWDSSRSAESIGDSYKNPLYGNEAGRISYVPLHDGLDEDGEGKGPIDQSNGQTDIAYVLENYGEGIATITYLQDRDEPKNSGWYTPAEWAEDCPWAPWPMTAGFIARPGVVGCVYENADGDKIEVGKAHANAPSDYLQGGGWESKCKHGAESCVKDGMDACRRINEWGSEVCWGFVMKFDSQSPERPENPGHGHAHRPRLEHREVPGLRRRYAPRRRVHGVPVHRQVRRLRRGRVPRRVAGRLRLVRAHGRQGRRRLHGGARLQPYLKAGVLQIPQFPQELDSVPLAGFAVYKFDLGLTFDPTNFDISIRYAPFTLGLPASFGRVGSGMSMHFSPAAEAMGRNTLQEYEAKYTPTGISLDLTAKTLSTKDLQTGDMESFTLTLATTMFPTTRTLYVKGNEVDSSDESPEAMPKVETRPSGRSDKDSLVPAPPTTAAVSSASSTRSAWSRARRRASARRSARVINLN